MPPKKAAAAGGASVAKKKSAKNSYQMPEPVPPGTILREVSKQEWRIGRSIGVGGFGEIYAACKANGPAPKRPEDYPFVVKIEPQENGPLFVEMHFYMRNAKTDKIEAFRKQRKLSRLGMPHFVGSGSHEINAKKHRFLVMPRFGKDIEKCWRECGCRLPPATAYRLSLQMLDVLEYIHSCGYVHADLKGANILLDTGAHPAQAYLVDFGMATHYNTGADFKPDPKKMHNGTIEFTSCDAHCGVMTRRGDLEVLAYNLVHWSGGKLPWETAALLGGPPQRVHEAKKAFAADIAKSLGTVFGAECPEAVAQFFRYVATLRFDEAPDYGKCRKIFEAALKSLRSTTSGPLEFGNAKSVTAGAAAAAAASPKKATARKGAIVGSPKKAAARKAVASARGQKRPSSSEEEDQVDDDDFEPLPVKKSRAKPVAKSSRAVRSEEDDESSCSSAEEVMPAKKARKAANGSAEKENKSQKSTSSKSNGDGGSTTVNNYIKGRKKEKKTYEFNIELDVSLDANVVINARRKGSAAPAKTVSGRTAAARSTPTLATDDDDNGEIEASPNVTPVVTLKRVLKKDSSRVRATTTTTTPSRRSPRN